MLSDDYWECSFCSYGTNSQNLADRHEDEHILDDDIFSDNEVHKMRLISNDRGTDYHYGS